MKKHTSFADENVPKWVSAVKEDYGQPTTKFVCVGCVLLTNLYLPLLGSDSLGIVSALHMFATS